MGKLVADLALSKPAYHHVDYHGVPIFRAHAWALEDARIHGQRFTVLSGDRRTDVIRAFNREHGTNLHDQAFLFDGWNRRLPGFLPANPPDRGTHLLLGDGVVGTLHEPLKPYQLGLDIVSAGHVNDCAPLVAWLNAHGYHATRPYHSGAEAHHVLFTRSPATNARRRLAVTR
jgi:hypothetical protein